ncbi:hypothetical protein [Paenibacillus eucommiae]|uniref:DNA gyrase inhibitor GyrI n=1 Tax=Paenibacillus eucommiae TaxID=1355755 RepID=A0ABS4J501_9BACL|nr:hypothetical protein [Paenibacillus eucommiae]MBP1994360.1 DNA gyrase inhibitor GyrI [Paenibacillus eucommiae]
MDIYIPIEPVMTETKELIELQPYRAAYYKAVGGKGRKWHQVKKEAFAVMIKWALAQGFDSSDLRIRVHNNGGAAKEEFYYEVHMDITEAVSVKGDSQVSLGDCEGGSFVVTPALHRMLEPTSRAFCRWLEQQEMYIMTGKCFEEFLIQDGKVELDTVVRIHFGAKRAGESE